MTAEALSATIDETLALSSGADNPSGKRTKATFDGVRDVESLA